MKEAYPPLAEVRSSYKVSWYRCPIASDQLKVLTTRSNLKGTAQSLGYLALLVVVGGAAWYFFSARLWAPMAVALYVYGTICSFNPGLVTHELSHGTVFRTKWPNALFLRFYSLLGWTNFHQYKRSHTFHHLYTLHPRGDREVVLPATPSLHPVRLFLLFTFNFESFWKILRATVRLAFLGRFTTEWLTALYPPEEKKALRQARSWAWMILLFHAVVIAVSVVFQLWPLLALVTVGMFIANWWSYFIGVTMHHRPARQRQRLPSVRAEHQPGSLFPFHLLAHELPPRASHVRRGALLQSRPAPPAARARYAQDSDPGRRLAGDAG